MLGLDFCEPVDKPIDFALMSALLQGVKERSAEENHETRRTVSHSTSP
jgi:hypothetical protein